MAGALLPALLVAETAFAQKPGGIFADAGLC